jgi:hypothetical protein
MMKPLSFHFVGFLGCISRAFDYFADLPILAFLNIEHISDTSDYYCYEWMDMQLELSKSK